MAFKIKKPKSELFRMTDAIRSADDETSININRHGDEIIVHIELNKIKVENQVRQSFNDDAINDLASSIKSEGLLYPVIVMKTEDLDTPYTLLVGENRYRAFQQLGKETIPARVKPMIKSHSERSLIQLTENIQRNKLSAIDTANSLKTIKKELKLTHEKLSERIGLSPDQLKKYSRISSLTKKEQESLKYASFKEIMNFLTIKNKKSAPGALLSKNNQLSLFKETKNGVELKSIKLNFNKITLEELESKVEACETFLKVARDRIDSFR
tara:strand:- start:2018 stop:2824 length:807 start_codon:yes stop_codon:yes gene_type:complete